MTIKHRLIHETKIDNDIWQTIFLFIVYSLINDLYSYEDNYAN